MTDAKLKELKGLAEKVLHECSLPDHYQVGVNVIKRAAISSFYAAANPQAVLELIAEIEEQKHWADTHFRTIMAVFDALGIKLTAVFHGECVDRALSLRQDIERMKTELEARK